MLPWYKQLLTMRGPQKERWMRLCEQIAEERDPVRFSKLARALLAELEAKDKRLKPVSDKRVPSEQTHRSS